MRRLLLFLCASVPVSLCVTPSVSTAVPGADPPAGGFVVVTVPPTFEPIGPSLAVAGGAPGGSTGESARFVLSWLEPLASPDEPERRATRFRLAILDPSLDPSVEGRAPRFEEPVTVTSGNDFWPNWADVSGVLPVGEHWYAHRLRTLGEGTYDYGIDLLHSSDRGATWQSLGFLHEDRVPAEHGFVSYAANDLEAWSFWLDGRNMPDGGAQTLRATSLDGESPPPSVLIDDSVCECCPTAAAMTEDGPVVVYRDRTSDEIRDINIVRKTADGWSEPEPVHVDSWQIDGCPVNGPAIAAVARRLWVAWFTGANERARVAIALSHDSGQHFESPIELDSDKPIGRVSMALDRRGNAWVSWLAREVESGAESAEEGPGIRALLRVARVTPGGVDRVFDLSRFDGGRSSGIPRLAVAEGRLLVVWLEGGALRSSMLDLASVPRRAAQVPSAVGEVGQ